MTNNQIITMIDHTLLRANATKQELLQHCQQALEYDFASICVYPYYVQYCKQILGDKLPVGTVVGFPFGADTTSIKAKQAQEAISMGAGELDMVLNISALLDEDYIYVREDIRQVVKAADGRIVKVILENCYLNDHQKQVACELCMEAGAGFVKTSTGMALGGATIQDVTLMRKTVGDKMGVKAAGGIRTLQQCKDMIAAGANRIGTGSAMKIVQEIIGG